MLSDETVEDTSRESTLTFSLFGRHSSQVHVSFFQSQVQEVLEQQF